MTDRQDLTGKVAVITGASSGIGAASARRLRAEGMRLVVTARREERLQALAKDLGETEVVAGDICDPALAPALVQRALARFGRCDVVMNNAGTLAVGPVESLDIDKVCQMVRVNVEAAYRVAFEAMKHFKAAGRGDLVNLSSIVGTKITVAGVGWYAGTKYAIEGLTEALRLEGHPAGVRVTCIEPGMTKTEIFATPITSIPRPLDPEDIADAVVYIIASPAHVTVPRMMVLPACQPI